MLSAFRAPRRCGERLVDERKCLSRKVAIVLKASVLQPPYQRQPLQCCLRQPVGTLRGGGRRV